MIVSLPHVADMDAVQREFYNVFPANLTRGLIMTKSSAGPYLALGVSFRDGWLSPPERELTILRVGARTDAPYEIFHHRPAALANGVPPEVIDEVIAGVRSTGNNRLDALLHFVDQLVEGVSGAAPTTEAIQVHFTGNEIAEMVLLTGHYVMTAMFIKTMGISTDGERPALFPDAVVEHADERTSNRGRGNDWT